MYAVTVFDTAGSAVHTDTCADMNASKHSANTFVGLPYSLTQVQQHDQRVLDMTLNSSQGILRVLIQNLEPEDDFTALMAASFPEVS